MDSPAIARAVVEELLAAGMTDAVVCPGSRSAPLALTLADAERRGLVRLHVRIDERSAAYLALGLARVSRLPVAVVTTSGTAAVNLHPAMVEAAYSGVPLVAVTADRPGDVRGSGANQVIDQRNLYGADTVTWVDLEGLSEEALRLCVATTLAVAISPGGPVHLNVPLSEPLTVPGGHAVLAVAVREPARVEILDQATLSPLLPADVNAARGLLIAGDFDDEVTRHAAAQLAADMGWPVISEPSGNLSDHPNALRHGPLVLGATPAPEVVVTVGRIGLHRPEIAVLRSARAHIAVDVPPRLRRVDPARTASAVVDAVPVADATPDPTWLARWRERDSRAATVVDSSVAGGQMTGPLVARIVAQRGGPADLLVIGASFPVRHVSLYAGPLQARCIGNRGTSGIDGVISTAWGAAIAHADRHPGATTYALVGDITALYDRNGLLAAPTESLPRLTYVVVDNDGSGIFSMLEQGAPDFAADFERVFGTPHGADVAALLSAPRVTVDTVHSVDALASALAAERAGVHVIVAHCASRAVEAAQVADVQSRVAAAVV